MELRNFNDGSPITLCFDDEKSPLIKVGVDRDITYHKSRSDKRNALENRSEHDKFIIAWGGKWSSDVFHVSEEDIELALREE